jgi:hypothetical protein
MRADLARAAHASAPYDVAAGLASFEHALQAGHAGAGGASAAATGGKTLLGAALKGALLGLVMVGGAAVVESRGPSREDPALAPAPRAIAARVAENARAAPAPTLVEAPRPVTMGGAPPAQPVEMPAPARPPAASARAAYAAAPPPIEAPVPRGDDAPAAAGAPSPAGAAGVEGAPAAIAESAAPAGAGDPLAAELELVGRLRALGDGDPARSLALATEGNQRFPGGLFVQEREASAIAALVQLGRVAEARARARAFLAAYPRSSFAERIEKLVGGGGAP